MFGSFGWMELLLILIIVLIIFGAGKIPQLGEGLGKAIKGFKKSVHEPDPIDVTAAPPDQSVPPAQLGQPGHQQSGQPPAPHAEPAQTEPGRQTDQTRQG
jgi:sec-independent protein translocase protein TatA